MNTTNPNQFDPPSAEKLAQHLAAHPPVAQRSIRGWMLMVMAGALMLAMLLTAVVPMLSVLLLLAPLGLVWYLASRAQRARELHERVARVWELAMLRQHREALRRAWTLLPSVCPHAELHLRCVAVIAHTLDDLAHYSSAIVAFDYLLERLPASHPMALQTGVQRANAALCDDRLADADDALRKLRGSIEQLPPGPIPAGYQLAKLVQDVRTGHYAEAADHADDTAAKLKPLGVHAGYGYGLLAYCQHQLAIRNNDPPAAAQQQRTADHHWHNATLLIPPAALAYRYRELAALIPTDTTAKA
ncbi:MAG: hypothetical protein ACIAXF_06090 [Phycisphaerales bacterium JB063]